MKNLLLLSLLVGLSLPVTAGTLFFDDFQGGALGANWANQGPAQLTADPFDPANTVVKFNALSGGVNILTSKLFNVDVAQITVEFDYFGDDLYSGTGRGMQTGGYVLMNGVWMFGAGSYAAAFADLTSLTPGVWHHISETFRPADYFSGTTGFIAFEQWNMAPNAPGGALFDNIRITSPNVEVLADAPEPGTLSLLGAAGLFVAFRFRRARA